MIKALRVTFLSFLCLLSTSLCAQEASSGKELVARGRYLADVSGCKSCHASNKDGEFAGGKVTKSEFGVFYSPNISSDRDQGIGGWSLNDFSKALTQGVSPSGDHYYPVFPYTSYQNLTERDIEALYRYLLTTKPRPTPSKPHEIKFPYSTRSLLSIWKWLYFAESSMSTTQSQSKLENGRYILYAMTHCDQCHSPRTVLGGIVQEERLNGGKYNVDASYAPSLLPSKGGLKGWSVEDLETYLLLGETPNGDYVGGDMVEVIDNMTNYLTNEDIRLLSEYLLSL